MFLKERMRFLGLPTPSARQSCPEALQPCRTILCFILPFTTSFSSLISALCHLSHSRATGEGSVRSELSSESPSPAQEGMEGQSPALQGQVTPAPTAPSVLGAGEGSDPPDCSTKEQLCRENTPHGRGQSSEPLKSTKNSRFVALKASLIKIKSVRH